MWPGVFVDDNIKLQNGKRLDAPELGPVLTQKDPKMVVYISWASYNSGYPMWLTYNKDKRLIHLAQSLGGSRTECQQLRAQLNQNTMEMPVSLWV